MKKISSTICVLFYLLVNNNAVIAQNNSLSNVKRILTNINSNIDKAEYLAFDVEIDLTSDTVLGKYESDSKKVNYILHKSNVYYAVDGVEYMQNDSFVVSVYEQEKMILLTKQFINKNSSLFPLKSFSESALDQLASYYTITTFKSGSDSVIKFYSDSAAIAYKTIEVYYQPQSFTINKLTMGFMQPLTFNNDNNTQDTSNTPPVVDTLPPPIVNKFITMKFVNYRFVEKDRKSVV